jgi:adenylate kinase family enzyme
MSRVSSGGTGGTAVLFVTMHQGPKIKRKTLHFRAMHRGKAYYVGRHIHIFYTDSYYGDGFVMAKFAPDAKDTLIFARANGGSGIMPPFDGWECDKYEGIKIERVRPADWKEGDANEGKERVAKFLEKIKKDSKGGEFVLTIRDVCRNITAVKEFLPELLTEFPKIDHDGHGKITLQDLDNYFDPVKQKEYSMEKLDEFWGILVSKRAPSDNRPKDFIDLEDIAANVDFIDEKIPDLIEKFQDIDANQSCCVERVEFDGFFGNADIWLDSALRNIIGLGELKEQIHKFYWQQKLDRMRRRGGHMVTGENSIVIMFKGSPGTGKTTIGRLIARLLQKIDIIQSDTFVECQRDELVGDHIGATEKETQKKIEEAKGGVLFVDEAYRLNSDVFGIEAINCLMKAMTVKGTVMILAGYPKQMDEFVTANPGLKRRITYEMEFPDYSPTDLALILQTQIRKRGFLTEVPTETLGSLIDQSTSQDQRTCFNGGIGEHITRHAIFNLNDALVPMITKQRRGDETVPSTTLRLEDIQYGCKHIPPPPPPETLNFAKSSKVMVGGR